MSLPIAGLFQFLGKAIRINNQSYYVSVNGATIINLPAAGTYTITKDTTNTYLYYIEFIES